MLAPVHDLGERVSSIQIGSVEPELLKLRPVAAGAIHSAQQLVQLFVAVNEEGILGADQSSPFIEAVSYGIPEIE